MAEVDPVRARRLQRLRARRRRKLLAALARWVGALLVASLVIPAITTQWSDRQKELALKDSLISQFTTAAAAAIEDSGFLARDETLAATVVSVPALRAEFTATAKAWNIQAFTLESQLSSYFPHARLYRDTHTPFSRAFNRYNLEVQDYTLLAAALCPGEDLREKALKRLRDYLHDLIPQDSYWTALEEKGITRNGPACWRRSRTFLTPYLEPLGLQLLNKRRQLVDTIIHSNAQGYNVGFRDFLRQVLPYY